VSLLWWIFIPSFEEGTMRRSRKWNATLETAQRGEVKQLFQFTQAWITIHHYSS
jgi:hypothetical protein